MGPAAAGRPVIGLVGGVASGKSTVARLFCELGAGLLDADRAGHAVLGRPEVRQALLARWGAEILDKHGAVDRRAVARRVFAPPPAGPAERAFLEQLIHPLIAEHLRGQAAELATAGVRGFVLDAPLLVEAGWHTMCTTIVMVEAPRDVRLARAAQRGWSQEDFAAREAAQESLDVKRRLADVVIDNSESEAALRAAVRRVWSDLIGRQPSG